MVNYIRLPNLPEKADTVLIGEKYNALLGSALGKLGISTITVPKNPFIDERLAYHCDLSILHIGKNNLLLAPYLFGSEFEQKLVKLGCQIEYADINQGREYPDDAQLNICQVGQFAIFNPETAYITDKNSIKIECKQGYSRCSTCVVDFDAIITADRMIAKKAGEKGIDALLISSGYITLDGFDYGFIGGSTFKISKDTVAITGHLDNHPDKYNITDFLRKHGVKLEILTNCAAFDIGSAVPITEK